MELPLPCEKKEPARFSLVDGLALSSCCVSGQSDTGRYTTGEDNILHVLLLNIDIYIYIHILIYVV
jgi:hypothetical protein